METGRKGASARGGARRAPIGETGGSPVEGPGREVGHPQRGLLGDGRGTRESGGDISWGGETNSDGSDDWGIIVTLTEIVTMTILIVTTMIRILYTCTNESVYMWMWIHMNIYIYIWGCPINCADWCKSSKTGFATLYICTWLNCSQGGCLAFQLAGATDCLSAQIYSKSLFSSKLLILTQMSHLRRES